MVVGENISKWKSVLINFHVEENISYYRFPVDLGSTLGEKKRMKWL